MQRGKPVVTVKEEAPGVGKNRSGEPDSRQSLQTGRAFDSSWVRQQDSTARQMDGGRRTRFSADPVNEPVLVLAAVLAREAEGEGGSVLRLPAAEQLRL